MRHLVSLLITSLIVAIVSPAVTPAAVRLRPTPQKFRAFYTNEDARVPAYIRKELARPQQTARRGHVTWRVEADALLRDSLPTKKLSFAQGLPVGGLRAIAITTDGAVWAGGDEGLVRYQDSPDDWVRWQYFGGMRYLPSDEVTSLAAGEAGSVWVQTHAGICHIEFRPMTLTQKAA